jgi:hypothetical protein
VAKAIEVLNEDPNVLSGIKRQNFFRNELLDGFNKCQFFGF